jgi:hypothetical protein
MAQRRHNFQGLKSAGFLQSADARQLAAGLMPEEHDALRQRDVHQPAGFFNPGRVARLAAACLLGAPKGVQLAQGRHVSISLQSVIGASRSWLPNKRVQPGSGLGLILL